MPNRVITRSIATLTGAVIMLAVATACGSDGTDTAATTTAAPTTAGADRITVTDVWARPGIAGGNTGIYLTIHGGATADELVGATAAADFAKSVEVHETVAVDEDGSDAGSAMSDSTGDDGHDMPATSGPDMPAMSGSEMPATSGPAMQTMREVESIPVPAGGTVELKPGAFHVMVMGLQADLEPGDTFPVTLTFAEAGEMQVTATVREP